MTRCDNCNSLIQDRQVEVIENNVELCGVCYDKYLNYEIQFDEDGSLVRIAKYHEKLDNEAYWWGQSGEEEFYDEDRPY